MFSLPHPPQVDSIHLTSLNLFAYLGSVGREHGDWVVVDPSSVGSYSFALRAAGTKKMFKRFRLNFQTNF
jgi:hypothetical protein